MPADYDAIRAGNIARYGTDTAVLALLGQLYSDRAQFLYELIQNAEDAGATWLGFALSADRLEVRHDGRPFTESDVQAICAVGSSTKPGDLTAIGRFGIGFKAVYAYTSTPQIHSPALTGSSGPAAGNSAGLAGSADTGEHFRIEHYVRPAGIPAAGRAGETLFVFPFDRADVPPGTAVDEVSAGLTKLPSRALLFLRSIGRITISGLAGPVTLERITEVIGPDRRRIRLRRSAGPAEPGRAAEGPGAGRPGGPLGSEDWLVGQRDVRLPEPALAGPGAGPAGEETADGPAGGQRVEIAVPLADGPDGLRASVLTAAPVVAFFATRRRASWFLVQPYRTTPARDNVPEHDPVNQYPAGQMAALPAVLVACATTVC